MHAYILFISYCKDDGVTGKGQFCVKCKTNVLALEYNTTVFLKGVETFIEKTLGYPTVVITNVYYKGYGSEEYTQGYEVIL